MGIVGVFIFGILTISGHNSKIDYNSKWFFTKSCKEYSFDRYITDIKEMKNEDIIENLAAELYKLNDINRQKMKTMKWEIRSFSLVLMSTFVIIILFLLNSL